MHSGREIAELQNSGRSLRMLAAQRRLYTEAKRVKAWEAAVCLGIPLLATAIQVAAPIMVPIVACVAIELAAFVVGIVLHVRAERKVLLASSVQQRFDMELYGLGAYGWPGLSESIVSAAKRYAESGEDPDELLDWYGTTIADLGPADAIASCQQTNVTWSLKLGRIWMACLVAASALCIAALAVPALARGIDVVDLFFCTTIVEWLTMQLSDGFSYLTKVHYLNACAQLFDAAGEASILRMQELIFEYRKSTFKVPDQLFQAMRQRYSSIGDDIVESKSA